MEKCVNENKVEEEKKNSDDRLKTLANLILDRILEDQRNGILRLKK